MKSINRLRKRPRRKQFISRLLKTSRKRRKKLKRPRKPRKVKKLKTKPIRLHIKPLKTKNKTKPRS